MGADERVEGASVDDPERSRASNAGAPAWTRVHSSDDLRSVSSARVRFTSLDVTRTRLVLGANTGSAYVFARARERVGEREARGRLLAVISPESGERDGGGTRARAAAQSVRCVRASPCGRMCALGFADGCVRVIELETEGTGEDGRRRNGAGELVGQLTTTHEGRSIMALSWSRDSKTLYAGSDRGRVSLLSCAAFVQWCEGGCASARPAVVNKTEYVDVGSSVHDIDASTSGRHVIISAQSSAQLIVVDGDASGTTTNIGSKQREGAYGCCFHEYANLSIGDEGVDEDGVADENWDPKKAALATAEYAVLSRPARKLWIAKVKGEDANVEVLATIKPEVPDPSFAPGWDGKKESAEFLKRMSKKLEFGIVQRLGPCILSTTDRAVSIIDIVTPTISRWYPLKEPGSELISAGFVDVRVCEHRAFFLTPSEEGGSSVWCLESFESSIDVARDMAKDFSSVNAIIQALEICQKTMSFEDDLFTRAKAALNECKDEDARSRLEFLIRWGEDTGAKLPNPTKPVDLRRVAAAESLPSPKPEKTEQSTTAEHGKPPLSKERAVAEASTGSAAKTVSNEFPKAESDGGIFFYNPRGVSKSTVASDADPQKKPVKVVKKRHAQILDDVEENVPMVSIIEQKEVKVAARSDKDYRTEWPMNDEEWDECDKYDAQIWKEAIKDAQKSFEVEGERFDHWSSYTSADDNLDGQIRFQGGNARMEYRSAMKVRVELVVECASALRESRASLDAAPLVRRLQHWRSVRNEMLALFTRYNQDEHKSLTEKINALIEDVLGSAEEQLDALCEELQLDTTAVKESAQHIVPPPTVERDVHGSMQLESLKSILMAQGSVEEVNQAMESECISALRRCESSEAMEIVKESLRRALSNLVESGDNKPGMAAEVDARMKLIARVGSAALGPAEVMRALCEASEDDSLSKAMASTDGASATATALSEVLTTITSFLTSENAIDLDMRRDAANLLKPLHQHLSRPPMRAFGRFAQLQAALRAELDGELESLPFIERSSSNDDRGFPWQLKDPHKAPISASIGDFGDWGVKMDLSGCPACRHSLLAQDEPLITFMCSHTYHKSCIVDSAACFACCCDM